MEKCFHNNTNLFARPCHWRLRRRSLNTWRSRNTYKTSYRPSSRRLTTSNWTKRSDYIFLILPFVASIIQHFRQVHNCISRKHFLSRHRRRSRPPPLRGDRGPPPFCRNKGDMRRNELSQHVVAQISSHFEAFPSCRTILVFHVMLQPLR